MRLVLFVGWRVLKLGRDFLAGTIDTRRAWIR
jgi:hypothetical protein